MEYRWIFNPDPNPEQTENLSGVLNNLPLSLARALIARGVETFEKARTFFRPSLDQLHDPFLMQDMDAAIARIVQAVEAQEKVLVYGDYDVDGTTSTALMTLFLRELGLEVSYWIPDRIKDGYGLCNAGMDIAVERGASLVIALDCGVTAVEEAAYAKSIGLDLIICDHHKPSDTLPDAIAVLDPKRDDCPYPFKELSGCGIGFKVIQGVLAKIDKPAEDAYPYLDLVAISTASDIVPLEGENRVLMVEGLNRMRDKPRRGVKALASIANQDLRQCSTGQIVFGIGPRINAAGRLGDAQRAVALLVAEEDHEAYTLAQVLEQANQKRRDLDRDTQREAMIKAERQLSGANQHGVVVHDEDWHPGVVGIVASRLVEKFYRPAIVLTTVNGVVKGSARSIHGLSVYEAIKKCSDLLTTFGGHDYAAGLAMPEEKVNAFRERFNQAVGEMITPELMKPVIKVDASLDLNEVSKRFWAVLKQFAPFGPANSKPVFMARDLELAKPPRLMGRDGTHLKFWVRQKSGGYNTLEVIGFGMHEYKKTLEESKQQGVPIEMLFSVEENTWNGVSNLQLKARDLRLQKLTSAQRVEIKDYSN